MRTFAVLFCILLAFPAFIKAQQWDFVKEKHGIKIYTKNEKNSDLKSFRGVVDLKAKPEKVFNLIGNVKNVDWWDKNLKEIKILLYEKDKHMQYYLVYDVPWPLSDRDLVVDATVTIDHVSGIKTIYSVPLKNVLPEYPDLVRIQRYWQKWTIQTQGDIVHVELEGFVDPAGKVPSWLYNMVITDTPLKIIHGIQERLEDK